MPLNVAALRSILTATILLAAAPGVWAAPIRAVKAEKANIRSGPSLSADIVDTAWRLTPFEALGREGNWAKVRDCEGYVGWIHASLLEDIPAVIVTSAAANIRSGPGRAQPVTWVVDHGYALQVVAREGDWLEVHDGDDVTGWIHRSIVWGRTEPGV